MYDEINCVCVLLLSSFCNSESPCQILMKLCSTLFSSDRSSRNDNVCLSVRLKFV